MLDSKKIVKVVSVVVASMSLLGVSASVSEAASFTGSKLGVAEVMPTNPAIKKGDRIFVVVKDTKNQKVNVLNANGKKTAKKVNGKKIVKINNSAWLNVKDVVKD